MSEKYYSKENAYYLIEALPYIRRFYGKTIVVKCGGSAINSEEKKQSIMKDLALLYFCGIKPVIVHGGGPEISNMCEQLQIPINFSNGYRVTNEETLEIVQTILLGKTNRNLVTALNQCGVQAVGISGHDASFITAKKKKTRDKDLGFVGDIVSIDNKLIFTLLNNSFIPIIAPVGIDINGQAYNINADIAAAFIAIGLKAEKIILLTDVDGLYSDINDKNTKISSLKINEVCEMLKENKIFGGMLPKIEACIESINKGVLSAHILNGKKYHSLLLEIFTDKGVGTMITA